MYISESSEFDFEESVNDETIIGNWNENSEEFQFANN